MRWKGGPRVLLAIGISCLVYAQDSGGRKLGIAKTECMDFPLRGVLHLERSLGEVTVEGWDQPGMEITITEPQVLGYDRAQQRRLGKTDVIMERRGNEVIIATALPRRQRLANHAGFDYRVRIPRDAGLIVDHAGGEVHVTDVAGNLSVTTPRGEITVRLPQDGGYVLDAKSSFGGVVSDIPGRERRSLWLVGHRFIPDVSEAEHKLYLRTGYGDIIIRRTRRPTLVPSGQ